MNMARSPGLGSSSSVLFEFLLFDMLRPTSEDGSSFFGVNVVFRLISVLVDWLEPIRNINDNVK